MVTARVEVSFGNGTSSSPGMALAGGLRDRGDGPGGV